MALLTTDDYLEAPSGEPTSLEELRAAPGPLAHLKSLIGHDLLTQIGAFVVCSSVFLMFFGPLLAPYNPTAATAQSNLPPSAAHWFGTDASGLDVFSRVIAAPRTDLSIALVATAVSFVAGSTIGLVATFFGGRLGELVMRSADTVQAFPIFVLAIVVVVLTGRGIGNIVIVVGVLNAPIYIRLMRSQVLSLRERTFIEAARASGASRMFTAWQQVLPNAIGPGVAQLSMTIGWSILVTTGLSFVGAGVLPPAAEWGSMISAGANGIIIGQWWPSLFPGIAMAITVFGFAALGDALQTAFRREA